MFDENGIGVTAGVADQIEPNTDEEAVETTEQPEDAPEQEAEPQEPEISNDVWATARRRSEREAQERIDRRFAQRFAGYKNPKTGAPIRSADDYFAAMDAQAEMQRQRAIEQATANQSAEQREALRRILDNDPEKARLNARVEELEHARVNDEAQAAFQRDFTELQRLEPGLKTTDDLAKLENFDKIVELVQSKGLDMVTAYKAVNYGRAVQTGNAAGRQAAINAARGKTHLAAHGGTGQPSNLKPIPDNMRGMLKDAFPGKSDEELTKLYNQTL